MHSVSGTCSDKKSDNRKKAKDTHKKYEKNDKRKRKDIPKKIINKK